MSAMEQYEWPVGQSKAISLLGTVTETDVFNALENSGVLYGALNIGAKVTHETGNNGDLVTLVVLTNFGKKECAELQTD